MKPAAVAVALSLLFAVPAGATQLTCGSLSDALEGSSVDEQNVHNAFAFGSVGGLGELLCLAADPRCPCFRETTDFQHPIRPDPADFAEAFGRISRDCSQPSRDRLLSGVAQQAALEVCP